MDGIRGTAVCVLASGRGAIGPRGRQDLRDIALAGYEDLLAGAKTLKRRSITLIAKPTEESSRPRARAWQAARDALQQTEGYRFGNTIVDEWEGKVNAWPLDEGLIDYVDESLRHESDENPLYTANVIANAASPSAAQPGRHQPDHQGAAADKLHEAGDVEANVATGYHAIEFLLWGQDLNGTGPGAGKRPASDYDTTNCTHGNCDRRAAVSEGRGRRCWSTNSRRWRQLDAGRRGPQGAARSRRQRRADTIFTGLGSLSYGELAGERMKLGLILHDPEEEHDCFSDNTHNSHYYDEVGHDERLSRALHAHGWQRRCRAPACPIS